MPEHAANVGGKFVPGALVVPNSTQRVGLLEDFAPNPEVGGERGALNARPTLPGREVIGMTLGLIGLPPGRPYSHLSGVNVAPIPAHSFHPVGKCTCGVEGGSGSESPPKQGAWAGDPKTSIPATPPCLYGCGEGVPSKPHESLQ